MDVFAPLQWLSDWLTYDLLGLSPDSRLGPAVNFFLYDVPKILLLLVVVIFVVSYLRSYLPPEKTRHYLSKLPGYWSNFVAAVVGVITPFCSCSAVPLFIGFVEAGVPLGVTFTFLIASPLVDVVALTLLASMFSWKVALFYLLAGFAVAIVGGVVLGKLNLEDQIEEYVWNIRMAEADLPELSAADRRSMAWDQVKQIVGRVWPYVIVGIAIGGFMHGFVPGDVLAQYAGPDNPLAVLVAVAVGIPLYSNVAGVIPVASVLAAKGVAIGTVIAFLMATVALSIPEFIILRKVMKPKLIALFVGINFVTIATVGYLFNAASSLLGV